MPLPLFHGQRSEGYHTRVELDHQKQSKVRHKHQEQEDEMQNKQSGCSAGLVLFVDEEINCAKRRVSSSSTGQRHRRTADAFYENKTGKPNTTCQEQRYESRDPTRPRPTSCNHRVLSKSIGRGSAGNDMPARQRRESGGKGACESKGAKAACRVPMSKHGRCPVAGRVRPGDVKVDCASLD